MRYFQVADESRGPSLVTDDEQLRAFLEQLEDEHEARIIQQHIGEVWEE